MLRGMKKECRGCNKLKNLDEFSPSLRYKRVISDWCYDDKCQDKHRKVTNSIIKQSKPSHPVMGLVNWNETGLYC